MKSNSEIWILTEEEKTLKDKIKRLKWLLSVTPKQEYFKFHGAFITYYLFEEARYCFVYGQYLATILLGTAFVEQTLCSVFYAEGNDKIDKISFVELIKKAYERNWLTKSEYNDFNRIRKYRNPVTHFRKYFSKDRIEMRSVKFNKHQYVIIEKDAKLVIKCIFKLLSKFY